MLSLRRDCVGVGIGMGIGIGIGLLRHYQYSLSLPPLLPFTPSRYMRIGKVKVKANSSLPSKNASISQRFSLSQSDSYPPSASPIVKSKFAPQSHFPNVQTAPSSSSRIPFIRSPRHKNTKLDDFSSRNQLNSSHSSSREFYFYLKSLRVSHVENDFRRLLQLDRIPFFPSALQSQKEIKEKLILHKKEQTKPEVMKSLGTEVGGEISSEAAASPSNSSESIIASHSSSPYALLSPSSITAKSLSSIFRFSRPIADIPEALSIITQLAEKTATINALEINNIEKKVSHLPPSPLLLHSTNILFPSNLTSKQLRRARSERKKEDRLGHLVHSAPILPSSSLPISTLSLLFPSLSFISNPFARLQSMPNISEVTTSAITRTRKLPITNQMKFSGNNGMKGRQRVTLKERCVEQLEVMREYIVNKTFIPLYLSFPPLDNDNKNTLNTMSINELSSAILNDTESAWRGKQMHPFDRSLIRLSLMPENHYENLRIYIKTFAVKMNNIIIHQQKYIKGLSGGGHFQVLNALESAKKMIISHIERDAQLSLVRDVNIRLYHLPSVFKYINPNNQIYNHIVEYLFRRGKGADSGNAHSTKEKGKESEGHKERERERVITYLSGEQLQSIIPLESNYANSQKSQDDEVGSSSPPTLSLPPYLLSLLPSLFIHRPHQFVQNVVLIGCPNVGKSSLIHHLSSGRPTVHNFSFTTKGITLGHYFYDDQDERRFDTPVVVRELDGEDVEGKDMRRREREREIEHMRVRGIVVDKKGKVHERLYQRPPPLHRNEEEKSISDAIETLIDYLPPPSSPSPYSTHSFVDVSTSRYLKDKPRSSTLHSTTTGNNDSLDTVRVQIYDSPGLLFRPDTYRKNMELLTLSALEYLSVDIVIFVTDISQHSGYTVEEQLSVRNEIWRRYFVNRMKVDKNDPLSPLPSSTSPSTSISSSPLSLPTFIDVITKSDIPAKTFIPDHLFTFDKELNKKIEFTDSEKEMWEEEEREWKREEEEIKAKRRGEGSGKGKGKGHDSTPLFTNDDRLRLLEIKKEREKSEFHRVIEAKRRADFHLYKHFYADGLPTQSEQSEDSTPSNSSISSITNYMKFSLLVPPHQRDIPMPTIHEPIFVSSTNGQGISTLKSHLQNILQERRSSQRWKEIQLKMLAYQYTKEYQKKMEERMKEIEDIINKDRGQPKIKQRRRENKIPFEEKETKVIGEGENRERQRDVE